MDMMWDMNMLTDVSKPIVVLVNGFPTSGKDTFCEFAEKKYVSENFSTVGTVKEIARMMGWDGEKTPRNRDMLSALKDFYVEWFDGTFNEITNLISSCQNTEVQFVFIHAREPEEIGRVKNWCRENKFRCYTVFIFRIGVSKEHGNHADANVQDFSYDVYLNNCGTLEEFEEKSLAIFRRMIDNRISKAISMSLLN